MVPKLSEEQARIRIARRIAREFVAQNRELVINLGVGIPTMVANYITQDSKIFIQAENGILGAGPIAQGDQIDRQLINAGRQPITETFGCCYFDSAMSFGMIRGGHVDATVIGALQVDQEGSIANWIIPNGKQLGVGGAMDLVTGAKQVIVGMQHITRDGKPKLVAQCNLPITGFYECDMVVTELALFTFDDRRMILEEIAPEITLEGLRAVTDADFAISEGLTTIVERTE